MTDKQAGADTAKFKMKPHPGGAPGKEFDGKGNEIPLAQRTEEDQAAAILAGEAGTAAANPENEKLNPLPTPRPAKPQ